MGTAPATIRRAARSRTYSRSRTTTYPIAAGHRTATATTAAATHQDQTRSRIAVTARKRDRKSTRLNSSHSQISYAVFCLKKKTKHDAHRHSTNPDNTTISKSSTYSSLTYARLSRRSRIKSTANPRLLYFTRTV